VITEDVKGHLLPTAMEHLEIKGFPFAPESLARCKEPNSLLFKSRARPGRRRAHKYIGNAEKKGDDKKAGAQWTPWGECKETPEEKNALLNGFKRISALVTRREDSTMYKKKNINLRCPAGEQRSLRVLVKRDPNRKWVKLGVSG